MDTGEIKEKELRILEGFRLHLAEYYEKLGKLHEGLPNFDVDIATDLHPELADYNNEAGRARLAFWSTLSSGLADEPKYTLIRRYGTRKNSWRSPGTGHGSHLRDEPLGRSIEHAWVEVYEDLRPEDIRFGRDMETGIVCVYIDAEATVTHTKGADLPTFLFRSDAPDAWVRDKQAVTPHSHEPEVFFYANDAEMALNHDYTHINDGSNGGLLHFPVRIDEALRQTVLERLRTSSERSSQDLRID